MLGIERIRRDPEGVRQATIDKGFDGSVVDSLLSADERRISILREVEGLRGERKRLTKADVVRGREIKTLLRERQDTLTTANKTFINLMLRVPNPSASDVKVGTAADNEILRKVGEPREFPFQVRDHVEIGSLTDTIDTDRGAKVAQSGFYYIKGEAALLEFALVQYAMGKLSEKGFTPVITPNIVKPRILVGCGFQPRGEEERQIYSIEGDDLDLIATAEITLVGQHADETIEAKNLPKKYVGYSYCYRRERGSYGRDVRGILRVHEFRKVEMVIFCLPEESDDWHEKILGAEEELWQGLEVPYRVVKMASGDLGSAAARKYDLEAWMPSQNNYREVTSTSNTTDFQSRRLGIKYRSGGKSDFLHTLNGTALALGRTMIAIYENYQNPDGSVTVPKVLQPWMNGQKTIQIKKVC